MTVPIKINRNKLPVKWAPVKFKHFYQFVDDCDALVEHYDYLVDVMLNILSGGALEEIEAVQGMHDSHKDLIRDCRESLRRYDRDGDNDPRYDDDGDLTFEHARDRLALLLQSWSNAKSDDKAAAAVTARLMVEHVLAREPSACELESTCRKLVDEGKDFAPQTPGVIQMLKAEQKVWQRRKLAIEDVDRVYRQIIEDLPKEKAKREAEQKEREAAAAEAARLRRQQKIDAAYCRGIRWLLSGSVTLEIMLPCGPEYRQRDRGDELVAYAMACFEVAQAQREEINARVRDGSFARRCEEINRHYRLIAKIARRNTVKWRIATRLRAAMEGLHEHRAKT